MVGNPNINRSQLRRLRGRTFGRVFDGSDQVCDRRDVNFAIVGFKPDQVIDRGLAIGYPHGLIPAE